jgi:hypothetical protein
MSVNWSWKGKFGEITLVQNYNGEEHEFTISIYHANCLFCMLHEFTDEDGGEKYTFYGFFNDESHLKRCIGLEAYDSSVYDAETKRYKIVKRKENMYMQENDKWTEIRLDSRAKESIKLAKLLSQAGFRVVLDRYDYYHSDASYS